MLKISEQTQLRSYTTFKTGGAAQFFVSVTTEAELVEAVAYARAHKLAVTILGGGSNVLVSDDGVRGLVIHMAITGVEVQSVHDDVVLLTVGAGEILDEVIAATVEQGFWGLENLSHIPGTVGATPVQNVGAYGVEVASYIRLVRVFDTQLEMFTTLTASDCAFGYRDSIFKHEAGSHYVVTAVTFALSQTPTPKLAYKDLAARFEGMTPTQQEIRDALIAIRGAKFPDWHTVGTAGSFFKNPIVPRATYEALVVTYPELPGYDAGTTQVKIPLGWILDKALNLKGQGTESVGCYEGQALVLYTKRETTTSDVLHFAASIIARVEKDFSITIEKEVTLLE